MSAGAELKRAVDAFVTQLDAVITRRANEAFAAKFEVVRAGLVGPVATRGAVARKVGRPAGKRSSRPSIEKPCPVCGKQNKGRRFSYLCEDHRSPENLAKFKGGANKASVVEATKPTEPKTETPKPVAPRRRGRPPKANPEKR